MEFSAFDPNQFERNHKHTLSLELDAGGHDIELPVLLARGAQPGPTLVVTAGVHGDEFEGMQAIFDAFDEVDAGAMSGDLLTVSVANPPAFWNGTRTSPLDGGNLARVFPGDPGGSPTEAIAHALAQAVIARADFYLDLHSAGVRWLMPTMAGYDANDPRGREAALCFGAKVVWGHPVIAPGRTISFANERGIPWLYTEARGAGRIDPDDLRIFREGIFNLLRHLDILRGIPDADVVSGEQVQWHLEGDGNIEGGAVSTKAGFFVPEVGLLEQVTEGQELGRTVDFHGKTIEMFRAESSGVIALVRQFRMVQPGEPMFVVADVKAAGR